MIKQAVALATTAAAALSLTLIAAPANASWDSTTSAVWSCPGPDTISARGWFEAYGDKFDIADECADGHSATIYADAKPFKSGNGYDFKFQNFGGKDTLLTKSHNLPEGTDVAVRACVTEGSTNVHCGPWEDDGQA